tara:strand:+ start:459 stop:1004 length:546 start_codon:yes stop_codon:yes gene_type:complete
MQKRLLHRLDTPRTTPQAGWFSASGKHEIPGLQVNYLFGLRDLCEKYLDNSKTVLELGSYAGVSTELFSYYCKHITTIDRRHRSGIVELARNANNVTFIHSKFQTYLNKCVDKFDLIYIDGKHTYIAVKRDITLSLPLLKDNGIISGHDIDVHSGVRQAVEEVLPDNNIEIFSDSSWVVKL